MWALQCADSTVLRWGHSAFHPQWLQDRGPSPAGAPGRGDSGERAAARQGRCAGLLGQAGWGTARTLNAVCRGTGLSLQHRMYLWGTAQPRVAQAVYSALFLVNIW